MLRKRYVIGALATITAAAVVWNSVSNAGTSGATVSVSSSRSPIPRHDPGSSSPAPSSVLADTPPHKGSVLFTPAGVPLHAPYVAAPPASSTPTATATASASSSSAPPARRTALRPLRIISTDFHISPIADLKDIISTRLAGEDVTVKDLSLSGACGRQGTCARPDELKVLQQGQWEKGIYATTATKREFFSAYATDPWLPSFDTVVCMHPTGMCEFYMPFNLSMVIWSTTRFEQVRGGNGGLVASPCLPACVCVCVCTRGTRTRRSLAPPLPPPPFAPSGP